jgi:hypothetical protein
MKQKAIQSSLPKIPKAPLPSPEEVRLPVATLDKILAWLECELPRTIRRFCWQVPVAVLIVILTHLESWL